MSKENTNCKLRFKGIETFLRRVAFNLGNTPSQTEVKIISCIPIDVTDLQQKIYSLEKELEEAKRNAPKESAKITCCPSTVIHTAVGCPASRCNTEDDDINQEEAHNKNSCRCSSVAQNSSNAADTQRDNSLHTLSCHSEVTLELPPHISDIYINANQERCDEHNSGFRKIFLRKRNKNKKKYQCNAQVYYAQTNERTPFNNNNHTIRYISQHANNASECLALSRAFLADMIEKQYKPEPIVKVFSNSSTFSAPVCKDIRTDSTSNIYKCESEICSCCVGPYHNLDNRINETGVLSNFLKNKRNPYYDSNLYDLVPVREKVARIKQSPREKNNKRQLVAKAYPEHIIHHNQEVSPKVPNCQPSRERSNDILLNKHSKQGIVLDEMLTKATNCRPIHPLRATPTSMVGCVDCGPVYKKELMKHNIPSSLVKDALSCPTASKNNKECIKAPLISEANAHIDKTAITLDQIKSILQTVLLEVKTNSKFGKSEDQPKKDAFVQNGAPQSNINGGSQFLQSLTYSPYNIDPFLYSSANKAHSGNCLYYPVLISPQRHCCINCYKNTSKSKPCSKKRATSAATNTDLSQIRNNQTEQLIKEIYKSIAINVERPQKDTVDNNLKISPNTTVLVHPTLEKPLYSTTNAGFEIFRNSTHLDSTITRNNTDNIFGSKPPSKEMAIGLDYVFPKSLTREQKKDKNACDDAMILGAKDKETCMERISRDQNNDDGINNETRSETESDGDILIEIEESDPPVETKKKKGLFKKMLNIFKPKEKNLRKNIFSKVAIASESDSDDYQRAAINTRRKPHSKAVNFEKHLCKAHSPSDAKLMPNRELQQRCWNEKIFNENRQRDRYSSRMKTYTPNNKSPVYTQNYETRSAVAHPLNTHNMTAYSVRCNEPQNRIKHGANKRLVYPQNPYTRNTNHYPRNKQVNRGILIHYPGKRHQGFGVKNNVTSCAKDHTRIIGPTIQKGTHKVSSKKVQTWLKNRNHVKCG